LEEEALDRTVWRTGFGRRYGPVAMRYMMMMMMMMMMTGGGVTAPCVMMSTAVPTCHSCSEETTTVNMQRCSYLVTTVLHWSAVLLLQFCRQVSEACCIYVQASVTSAISSDCTGFVRDLNVISTTLHLSFAQIVTLSCPDF